MSVTCVTALSGWVAFISLLSHKSIIYIRLVNQQEYKMNMFILLTYDDLLNQDHKKSQLTNIIFIDSTSSKIHHSSNMGVINSCALPTCILSGHGSEAFFTCACTMLVSVAGVDGKHGITPCGQTKKEMQGQNSQESDHVICLSVCPGSVVFRNFSCPKFKCC